MLVTSDTYKSEKEPLKPRFASEAAGGWWCPDYRQGGEKVEVWAIRTLEVYRAQMADFEDEVLFEGDFFVHRYIEGRGGGGCWTWTWSWLLNVEIFWRDGRGWSSTSLSSSRE